MQPYFSGGIETSAPYIRSSPPTSIGRGLKRKSLAKEVSFHYPVLNAHARGPRNDNPKGSLSRVPTPIAYINVYIFSSAAVARPRFSYVYDATTVCRLGEGYII